MCIGCTLSLGVGTCLVNIKTGAERPGHLDGPGSEPQPTHGGITEDWSLSWGTNLQVLRAWAGAGWVVVRVAHLRVSAV